MNDPQLNTLYVEELQREVLIKGPYLEGTLPFASTSSIDALMREQVLSPRFADLNQEVLPIKRPIYAHQERAIRKVVTEQRNLVVATGTGSGKTESFLIPLLQTLFAESAEKRRQKGVRALLLYPMNALANDQLKRLRGLLKTVPDISFGRFTGETENTHTKALERFRLENPGETPLPNERMSREQMRETPPDILITNYAMLEYLLLRPEDTVFFDSPYNKHWSMIVLDEVHTYNGALGVEIGMLLRRVKQRIGATPGQLRCIGTSATIGSPDEQDEVAAFAQTLFGETFEWIHGNTGRQDVVIGERVVVDTPSWGQGTPALYSVLFDGLRRIQSGENDSAVIHSVAAEVQRHIPAFDVVALEKTPSFGGLLYAVLVGDARTKQTQELLRQKAFDVASFASLIALNHVDDGDIVVRFIELLLHAKRHQSEKPLLPSRYHVFVKALEGMFVCLNKSEHADGQRKVFLKRHEVCPECTKKVYELSRCTKCGAPYLSGTFTPEYGIQLPKFQDFVAVDYLLLENEISESDEDDVVETPTLSIQSYLLCTRCGIPRTMPANDQTAADCACGSSEAVKIHRRIYTQKGDEELNRASYCVNCGASGGGANILMSAETGKDAPVGILASELYQHIPGNDQLGTIGSGRRMIIFADGRQDAAFFAPYLERNYGTAVHRRLILEALSALNQSDPGFVRVDDVLQKLRQSAAALYLFAESDSQIMRKTIVSRWITRDMIAVNRELTLETQGLLQYRLAKPSKFVTPPSLAAIGLTEEEAWDYMQLLFRTLRQRRVMNLPEGVDPSDDDFMPGSTMAKHVRKQQSGKNVFAWLPDKMTNMRLELTLNMLRTVKRDRATREFAKQILSEIWDCVVQPDGYLRQHFKSENIAREGVVFQLNYAMHELVPYDRPTGYQCTKCRAHAYVHVRGTCVVKNCTGKMEPIDPAAELTIYQRQYLTLQKTGMAVEEHSANLTSVDATDTQIRFTKGEINVLSCTTTFELGVDVGELQTVFMRNMPPSTANYIQRAGRAGRRDGSTAMIVTFCQRRSHDLTFFDDPVSMISGTIPAPQLQTQNIKITRRHVYAIVLAAFLRDWQSRTDKNWPSTSGAFFKRDFSHDQAVSEVVQALVDFINARPKAVQLAINTVLNEELRAEIGIDSWNWLGEFSKELTSGPHSAPEYLDSLTRAHVQLNEEFRSIDEAVRAVLEKGGNGRGIELQRLEKMLQTLEKRQLFGVLPNYGLMPKYGFPTDVVQLKTDHIDNDTARKLDLTRDLKIAIGEYSPGSQVVAAGRVWESGGIQIPRGKGLVTGKYVRCTACEYVTVTIGEVAVTACQNCGLAAHHKNSSHYIIPEFGFIAKHDSGQRLTGGRPPRGTSSRLAFSGETMGADPRARTDQLLIDRDIDVFFNRNVKLTAMNEGKQGRGFSFCEWCGYATTGIQSGDHNSPTTGRKCGGQIHRQRSLMHSFVTDVVEIQLNRSSGQISEWRGVLYAMLEAAAKTLRIERDEIDGMVYKSGGESIRLVIFDTVPGGAGFALQIADHVPAVLRGALAHVDSNCCGPETSCYRCLRTYNNDWYHQDLKRGRVVDQLQQVLGVV
jgi:ATP-dependent helicase YprA (DUF1998 family)